MIILTFTDDCGGIEQSYIDKVFEPFFTTKSDGTGLGLCIVKRILEVVGGKISVESRPGDGTTFFVKMPINAYNVGGA